MNATLLTYRRHPRVQEEPSDPVGGEDRPSGDDGDVPQQIALLEVWIGLPGHCTERETSLLSSALALSVAASTARCGEERDVGGEDQGNAVLVPSTLEVNQPLRSWMSGS